MKQFEAQRNYDVDLISCEYKKNLKRDYDKMEKYLEDKQASLVV